MTIHSRRSRPTSRAWKPLSRRCASARAGASAAPYELRAQSPAVPTACVVPMMAACVPWHGMPAQVAAIPVGSFRRRQPLRTRRRTHMPTRHPAPVGRPILPVRPLTHVTTVPSSPPPTALLPYPLAARAHGGPPAHSMRTRGECSCGVCKCAYAEAHAFYHQLCPVRLEHTALQWFSLCSECACGSSIRSGTGALRSSAQ